TPFLLYTNGTLDLSLANIRWVDGAGSDGDAATCPGGVINGGPVDEPSEDAPAPTPDAADVVSLWSNGAYTDVGVATWQTDWSMGATMVDDVIDTKTAKRLTFAGGAAQFLGVDLAAT